ncbi:MAG: hypothetical protein HQL71_05925, partial [Magnetococcales bacterium]|nr:hypothetical protein [Magnetococcales bacterium]
MLDVFNLVNHPLVPWVSVGLILLWGLVSWISFKARLSSVYRILDDTVENIDAHLNTPDFANSFQKLDSELSATEGIKVPWEAFRKTFIQTDGDTLQSSKAPATFFTFEALVLPRVDFRYYQTVPGYLIGGGIVLTMVVFAVAIYFIYFGLSSPDINIVKSSINGLLVTAVVKFSASIAGLFAGILFSIGEKVNHKRLESKIAHLCRLFSERIELVSDEQQLLNKLDKIGAEEDNTATTLRSLVADSELSQQSTAKIQQIVASLDNKVEALSQKSLEPDFDSVKEVVTKQGADNELMQKELLTEVTQLLSNKDLFSSIVDEVKIEIEKLVESGKSQMLEKDSGLKSEHLEVILSALRQEADRLEIKLSDISEQVSVSIEEDSEQQDTTKLAMEQSQLEEMNIRHLDALQETVRLEMAKITESLAATNKVESLPAPVVSEVVPTYEPFDTDKFVQPLQEALSAATKEIVVQPLRDAVSEATKDIVQPLKDAINEVTQDKIVLPLQLAINDATQDIKGSLSFDPIINTIKSENSILTSSQLEVLDTINQESNSLVSHIDKAVIDILQELPEIIKVDVDTKPLQLEEPLQINDDIKIDDVPVVEPKVGIDEELIKSVVLAVKAQEEELLQQDVDLQEDDKLLEDESIEIDSQINQQVIEQEVPLELPQSSVGISSDEVSSIIAAVEAIAEPVMPQVSTTKPLLADTVEEPAPVVAPKVVP